jgi:hypothetical protein
MAKIYKTPSSCVYNQNAFDKIVPVTFHSTFLTESTNLAYLCLYKPAFQNITSKSNQTLCDRGIPDKDFQQIQKIAKQHHFTIEDPCSLSFEYRTPTSKELSIEDCLSMIILKIAPNGHTLKPTIIMNHLKQWNSSPQRKFSHSSFIQHLPLYTLQEIQIQIEPVNNTLIWPEITKNICQTDMRSCAINNGFIIFEYPQNFSTNAVPLPFRSRQDSCFATNTTIRCPNLKIQISSIFSKPTCGKEYGVVKLQSNLLTMSPDPTDPFQGDSDIEGLLQNIKTGFQHHIHAVHLIQ